MNSAKKSQMKHRLSVARWRYVTGLFVLSVNIGIFAALVLREFLLAALAVAVVMLWVGWLLFLAWIELEDATAILRESEERTP